MHQISEIGSGTAMKVAYSYVLVKRGSKWVHETTGGSGREVTTIHTRRSASGQRLPEFVLYKGKHLYTCGSNGAIFFVSKSGWVEKANFLVVYQAFHPSSARLAMHWTSCAILRCPPLAVQFRAPQEAKAQNIHLICLPTHTSHILQPMAVSVYRPMKATWQTILKTYKTSTRAANITKEVFPSLLNHLRGESVCPKHITAGFKASGLHPINDRLILLYNIVPSVAITSTESQEIRSSCSTANNVH